MSDDPPANSEVPDKKPLAEVCSVAPQRVREIGTRTYTDFIQAAEALVGGLRHREEEFARPARITVQINYGIMLEEVLDFLYRA